MKEVTVLGKVFQIEETDEINVEISLEKRKDTKTKNNWYMRLEFRIGKTSKKSPEFIIARGTTGQNTLGTIHNELYLRLYKNNGLLPKQNELLKSFILKKSIGGELRVGEIIEEMHNILKINKKN